MRKKKLEPRNLNPPMTFPGRGLSASPDTSQHKNQEKKTSNKYCGKKKEVPWKELQEQGEEETQNKPKHK